MRREIWIVCVLALVVSVVGCKAPATPTALTPSPEGPPPVAVAPPAPEEAAQPAGKTGKPAGGTAKPGAEAGKSATTVATGSAADAPVTVVAFYPDNEGHKAIKDLVLGLPAKHGGKVKAEFVDFTADDGFKKWQDAGMTCGGILVNDEQTWAFTKDGQPTEVTFKMAMGGEWTPEDLEAVVKKALADKGGKKE